MKKSSIIIFPNWLSPSVKLVILVVIFSVAFVACNDAEEESLINDTGLCLVEINDIFEEVELDEAPKYLNGGQDGFSQDIGTKLKYPAEARENGIEGLCVINFEITEEGMVENVVAIQEPGGGIGNASVESIESVTEGISFSPGVLNGNPVRVKKELEIKFKLEG